MFSVEGQYDDNIFFADTDETGDFSTVLSPGLRIARSGERMTFSAEYEAGFGFYAHNPERNNISHSGLVNLGFADLGPGLLHQAHLDLMDNLVITQRLIDYRIDNPSLGGEAIITKPSTATSNTSSATFSTPLSEHLKASTNYTWSYTRYNQSTLINNNSQDISAELTDTVGPRVILGATYSLRILEYDDPNPSQRKTTLNAVEASINVVVTQTVDASLDLGATYFQTTHNTEPTGSFTITKHMQHTEASASYRRSIGSGGGAFSQPTTSETVSAEITRTMSDYMHASLSGSFDDYRGTGTDQGQAYVYSGTMLITYRIASWLEATAQYRHLAQQSTVNSITTNVRDNLVLVVLSGTWQWGGAAPEAEQIPQAGGNP